MKESMKKKLQNLKSEYTKLKKGKDSLLTLLDESEIPEMVYNSNAIENSTLTLDETQRILLDAEVASEMSVREVYEAKNLGRVISYIREKSDERMFTKDLILFLHHALMVGIEDDIAGRFRQKGEYVKIGTYIAPPPEKVEKMMNDILSEYTSDIESDFLEKIARFHLKFEMIHPFCDGNGRIGRVLLNYHLLQLEFPPIIIQNKGKDAYYKCFKSFFKNQNVQEMEKLIFLAILESLHKRITYLKGDTIVKVSEYAKKKKILPQSVLNAAKRQTIPAFREKGVWKISSKYIYEKS